MLTFFSFLLTFVGTLNWFFISAFQYDFIAGFFGTQSSLFSRFIYFLIGIAGFVLVIVMIKNKGKIKITENPFKKKKEAKPVEVISVPQTEKTNNFSQEENFSQANFDPENFNSQHYATENISSSSDKQNGEFKDFDVTKYDD